MARPSPDRLATPRAAPARRLCLSPAAAPFDGARDVVLGPWCLMGAAAPGVAMPGEPLDPEAVAAEARGLDRLCGYLLARTMARLNARHGLGYGVRFWRMAAMPALVQLAHVVRYRHLELEAALARLGGAPAVAEVLDDQPPRPVADFADLVRLSSYDPGFSWWVASVLLRRMAPDGVSFVPATGGWAPAQAAGAPSRLERMRPERVRIGSLGNEFTPTLKLKSLAAEWMLAAVGAVAPARAPAEGIPLPGQEAATGYPAAFLDALDHIVETALPRSLAEELPQRLATLPPARPRPGRWHLHTAAVHLDETARLRLARALDAGERLAGVQHGCNYGTTAAAMLAPETEYRADAFFTWGWEGHDDYAGRFVPLPAAQLAPWARQRRRAGLGAPLMLVGGDVRWLPGRFCFEGDLFNRGWLAAQRAAFAEGLTEAPRRALAYRPYPAGPASEPDDPRLAAIPRLDGPFHHRLARCRLLVIDHPGTVLYQALAAGVPLVAFWKPAAHAMAPQAAPLFDSLRAAGVLFDDGTAAAQAVSAIWDDVDGWWRSALVQGAVAALARHNARTERWWPARWAAALWRL